MYSIIAFIMRCVVDRATAQIIIREKKRIYRDTECFSRRVYARNIRLARVHVIFEKLTIGSVPPHV